MKAKKVTTCPHCQELNGVVKKVTAAMKVGGSGGSVLKIIHEKFRSKKEKDAIVKQQLGKLGTGLYYAGRIQIIFVF